MARRRSSYCCLSSSKTRRASQVAVTPPSTQGSYGRARGSTLALVLDGCSGAFHPASHQQPAAVTVQEVMMRTCNGACGAARSCLQLQRPGQPAMAPVLHGLLQLREHEMHTAGTCLPVSVRAACIRELQSGRRAVLVKGARSKVLSKDSLSSSSKQASKQASPHEQRHHQTARLPLQPQASTYDVLLGQMNACGPRATVRHRCYRGPRELSQGFE